MTVVWAWPRQGGYEGQRRMVGAVSRRREGAGWVGKGVEHGDDHHAARTGLAMTTRAGRAAARIAHVSRGSSPRRRRRCGE